MTFNKYRLAAYSIIRYHCRHTLDLLHVVYERLMNDKSYTALGLVIAQPLEE